VLTKINILRPVVLFICGFSGAYVGDLMAYITMYFLYPQSRYSNYFTSRYLLSSSMSVTIIFAMLIYSPGLLFAWFIKRPSFSYGATGPAIFFLYFLLIFFPGNFFRGGLIKYALVTCLVSLVCVGFLKLFQVVNVSKCDN
jgi:hypothetical protein